MKTTINNHGSVHDVQCTLHFINPKTVPELLEDLAIIDAALKDEKKNRNRSTVIQLLKRKRKYLVKLADANKIDLDLARAGQNFRDSMQKIADKDGITISIGMKDGPYHTIAKPTKKS